MDEREYKATYNEFNDRPCIFYKAILTRCAGCSRSQKILIAEREAVYCLSDAGHQRCTRLATELRKSALFALQLTNLADKLPHGKEIKVECGGLAGLAHQAEPPQESPQDIFALVGHYLGRYPDLESLPYQEVVKEISHYRLKKRSKRNREEQT